VASGWAREVVGAGWLVDLGLGANWAPTLVGERNIEGCEEVTLVGDTQAKLLVEAIGAI